MFLILSLNTIIVYQMQSLSKLATKGVGININLKGLLRLDRNEVLYFSKIVIERHRITQANGLERSLFTVVNIAEVSSGRTHCLSKV